MQKEWSKIRSILEKSLAPGQGKVWLSPLLPAMEEGNFVLYAPNEFVADFVRRRFFPLIVEAAHSVLEAKCPVQVCSRRESPEKTVEPSVPEATAFSAPFDEKTVIHASAPAAFMRQAVSDEPGGRPAPAVSSFLEQKEHAPEPGRPVPRPLSSVQMHLPMPVLAEPSAALSRMRSWRFSFDDFVVGPCNELAFAASRSMCADNSGADVLYLASPPGLGKTHLMQAAGKMLTEYCNRKFPKVEYLTAEEFSSRFWVAIKGNDTEGFKARYRALDLLLLEDVHFLQGKETMQAELLATLKAVQEKGGKVIFTSSFSPKDLKKMDEQLLSRLSAGLLSFIDRPNEETRRRIFRSKAMANKVFLPEDVEEVLARHINADVRQIESCLRNLLLKAKLYNSAINMQMAWEVIGNYASHVPTLNLDDIIDRVCKGFGLSEEQLFSSRRKQDLVHARNTAFYLARKHTDLSLEAIGQRFNRRHSTVIKGITSLEREISRQSPLGRQIAGVVGLIERNSAPLI